MKLNNKKLATFFFASLLATTFMGMHVSATSMTSYDMAIIKSEDIKSGSIQPRKDKIDWVYKSENGRVYRRLFNFSKNEWIGDWEVC